VSLNGVQELLDNPAIRHNLTASTADVELVGWLSECCHTPQSLKLLSTLAIRACFSSENITQIYDLPLLHSLLDFVAFASLDQWLD